MAILQSRRRFVSNAAIASVAGLGAFDAIGRGGGRTSLAAEPPPETTTIRIEKLPPAVCVAPQYVAEQLLYAEGFTDVRYEASDTATATQKIARGELDWAVDFAPTVIVDSQDGASVTMVAGVHVGCFELFAHEHIHSISDLKGRTVGIGYETAKHLVSIMASYVGLNPRDDIHWVSDTSVKPVDLFVDRKIDAFLASAPRPQELRARGIGHSLVNSAVDRPWSQYFCCMLIGRTDFVQKYPVATKRVIRAILKGADFCVAEPERAARLLVDRGYTPRYDYTLQALNELPYKVWRDYDPEDTARWYALRLNEAGFTKSTPQDVIAEHTDWRFLNELKRELKV